jgi:predicted ATP-dependent endonuclease of OLD family
MHPSIQRILIDTLVKFPNLQVFLTTHSNHFLDLSYDYPSDIGIFSFEKIDEDDEFYIKNITDNSSIIDLLGVRSSSVFLANSVIWTEGVTDRMLIRKLLELAEFNFKEDYHYALSEYGGNNLDNFNYSD